MRYEFSQLKQCTVAARDGDLGHVADLYFDDERWIVRYLVVETSRWLGRQVLLSPLAVEAPNGRDKRLPTALTTEQVRNSPPIDGAAVSREHEALLAEYYQWPAYWDISPLASLVPPPLPPEAVAPEPAPVATQTDDPHLRSANELLGFRVHARDGEVGHVEDLTIEPAPAEWSVRDLVIDTGHWLHGKHVLITPPTITRIDWSGQAVFVEMFEKDQIASQPAYDRSQLASL